MVTVNLTTNGGIQNVINDTGGATAPCFLCLTARPPWRGLRSRHRRGGGIGAAGKRLLARVPCRREGVWVPTVD
jgi:hypothetical protein